jgi:predicted AAA+ superfamily ATPase
MIIIHLVDTLPRLAAAAVAEAARAMPVVVISGARQTGKSTLARAVDPDRAYFTLDDLDVLDQARTDPEALVRRAARVTLDEIQRQPDLLLAIKREVDRKRQRGRFLLTGSANLLLLEKVSETLAGRATYISLWPMTRREQLGRGRCGLWPELFAAPDHEWPEVLAAHSEPPEDWRELARRGGYPTPALELEPAARDRWFAGYTQTYLERDLQQVSSISNLPDLRRLMRAVCLRLGQMMNQTELGRDVALPQPTIHRWLNVLEVSYQLVRLPAYAVNRTKRLIKAPKLYWSDTGLALHLVNGEAAGPHLENVVLNDLLAWRDTALRRPEVSYWRTAAGEEIDFVLELDGALLPIEIKASDRPRTNDIKHLLAFREEYGKRSRAGLLLHTGTTIEWLSPGVLAAPWWAVV